MPYEGDASGFYVAPEGVADTVNLAIALNRPLLVEGEPGCGKTRLADSIAAELALELVKIPVKSTSRAQDLLYRMNSLRRLQDAQRPDNPLAQFAYPYLELGPLGKAIQAQRRCVVLIDEIDKADIDFPNDLLDVLGDRFTFQVGDLPESEAEACQAARGFGRTVAGNPAALPIVVITSNREKRLPEPFLRRCLYVRVRFPESVEVLREIVRMNTGLDAGALGDGVLVAAIEAFLRVRRVALGSTQKPPSTSELIDWVQILHWKGETPETLGRERHCPPHWAMLFKTMADLDAYEALARSADAGGA